MALRLIEMAIKNLFLEYFPHPEKSQRMGQDPYEAIKKWFADGNSLVCDPYSDDSSYKKGLDQVKGLSDMVRKYVAKDQNSYLWMEIVLHGLSSFKVIGRNQIDHLFNFNDPLASILDDFDEEDITEEDSFDN